MLACCDRLRQKHDLHTDNIEVIRVPRRSQATSVELRVETDSAQRFTTKYGDSLFAVDNSRRGSTRTASTGSTRRHHTSSHRQSRQHNADPTLRTASGVAWLEAHYGAASTAGSSSSAGTVKQQQQPKARRKRRRKRRAQEATQGSSALGNEEAPRPPRWSNGKRKSGTGLEPAHAAAASAAAIRNFGSFGSQDQLLANWQTEQEQAPKPSPRHQRGRTSDVGRHRHRDSTDAFQGSGEDKALATTTADSPAAGSGGDPASGLPTVGIKAGGHRHADSDVDWDAESATQPPAWWTKSAEGLKTPSTDASDQVGASREYLLQPPAPFGSVNIDEEELASLAGSSNALLANHRKGGGGGGGGGAGAAGGGKQQQQQLQKLDSFGSSSLESQEDVAALPQDEEWWRAPPRRGKSTDVVWHV